MKNLKDLIESNAAANKARGRPRALPTEVEAQIVQAYASPERPTVRELAAKYGTSYASIWRAIKRCRVPAVLCLFLATGAAKAVEGPNAKTFLWMAAEGQES